MPKAKSHATIEWMDVDVGGDIHRVVLKGVPLDERLSVRERMEWLSDAGDGLRQLLIEPPYGEPSFCVDLITSPQHAQAQAAFVIMEVMGYPFFSGSNTMATACALVESGRIAKTTDNGQQCVRLEAPGGRVDAHVALVDGHVVSVAVEGDEAFVQAAEQRVVVAGLGEVDYQLVWSGGHYVMVNADGLGLAPDQAASAEGLALAGQIIEAIQMDFNLRHPSLGDVGKPRFLHWMWSQREQTRGDWHGIGATYGHPGVLWRVPTGTGTAARMALLAHAGRVAVGASLRNTSPSGATLEATLLGHGLVGEFASIHTRVVGEPRVVGQVSLDLASESPLLNQRNAHWLLANPSG